MTPSSLRPSPINAFGRKIGPGEPCFIVAELSGNHGGDLSRAKQLIHMAKASGADAVKLQAYFDASDMTVEARTPHFRVPGSSPWSGRSLWDLYNEARTPEEWFPVLFDEGKKAGIPVFATPFSVRAALYLTQFKPPAFKVASFEIAHTPLLDVVGAQARALKIPVILSTGMATDREITDARVAIDPFSPKFRETNIILMHCVSAYPAPAGELALGEIRRLEENYRLPVGYSDHSLGTAAPAVAVALGACIIEKHLTADDRLTVDSHFSLRPREFREMVERIREAEQMVKPVITDRDYPPIEYEWREEISDSGSSRVRTGWYARGAGAHPYPSEQDSMVFRRSLFSARELKAGVPLTLDDVLVIRPGTGMHPRYLESLVGRTPVRDIPAHEPLREEMFGRNS